MKSADSSTRDGDEREGKEAAGKYRPGTVDKARQRRHLQMWMNDDNPDSENRNGSQLHKCAEIVARRQQQPHRQCRRSKRVQNNKDSQRGRAKRKYSCRRRLRNPLSAEDAGHHQQKTERRRFHHFARTQVPQIDSHQDGNRNRHADGESSPGAGLERIDNHQRHHRQQHNDDADHGDE